jgi:hypothetical protein
MAEPEEFYRDFLPVSSTRNAPFTTVTRSPTSRCGPPQPR